MQHYLRPDLLEAAGISDFDTWAATFGQTVTQIEMAPEGGSSFRHENPVRPVHQRPGDAPPLARLRRRQDRRRPQARPSPPWPSGPPTASAPPKPSSVQPSDGQLDMHGRPRRPGRRDPQPRGACPTRTTCSRSAGDGRKAALDLRLLGLPMTDPGKIEHRRRPDRRICGERTATTIYPAPAGSPSPVRGSAAAGVLRPRHPRRRLERLRRAPRPARRPRPAPRADPVHPRRQNRPGQGRAVRRLPRRDASPS